MQEPIPFDIDLGYVTLRGLRWGKGHHYPVLAMHGWMDNSMSFCRIAPRLAEACDLDIWAIDLVGHGHSGHRPAGSYYHIWDNVIDMAMLMDAQGWEQADLLGHSMGAGVATLMAGAMPNRVRRVALIEGLGPVSTPAAESAQQLALAAARYKLQGYKVNGLKTAPSYSSVEAAAKARQKGISAISFDAALPLAQRGTGPRGDDLIWRSDPRLRIPSPVRLTEEQIYSFCQAICAPTTLIMGTEGFLVDRENTQQRISQTPRIETHCLPGNHHLHLEPQTAPAVVDTLIHFWRSDSVSSEPVS